MPGGRYWITYSTSLYFLFFTTVKKNGPPYKLVTALDPSIEYFSRDHAPFAVIAILILIGPVILPVIILALYPVRAFRSLLEKCKVSGHSRAALNLFVEKFYSCYRDGLQGGRDMRSFVFLPFFLRFLVFFGVAFQAVAVFWFFHFILYGGSSLLIATLQPYKRAYMNIIDSLILAVISLIGILYVLYLNLGPDESQHSTFFLVALCLNLTLPIFGIASAIAIKVIINRVPSAWISKVWHKASDIPVTVTTEAEESPRISNSTSTTIDLELPDRILHPDSYHAD